MLILKCTYGIVIAAFTAVALRAVRMESRVIFMLKLDDGDGFRSEYLLEECLMCLGALCSLP